MRINSRRFFLSVFSLFLLADPSIASERIIALAPNVAEIVSDLLGPARQSELVGVEEFSDRPASLKSLPKVGSLVHINPEAVLRLKPSLVIASRDGNVQNQMERLSKLGLRVEVVESRSVLEIRSTVLRLGKVLNAESRAQQLVQGLDQSLEGLRSKRPKRSLKIFVELGRQPLVTVGKDTLIHEGLILLGHQTVFSTESIQYPTVSREAVLKRKPDLVLILVHRQLPNQDSKNFWKSAGIPTLESADDRLLRPTPSWVDGLGELSKRIAEMNL
jgi:iron complex transport system substrate-binding protein